MAHVLIVAALQLRHPVTFFIQMKSSDLSLHYPRSYREWHRTISDGLTVNPCGCHHAGGLIVTNGWLFGKRSSAPLP